MFAFLCSLIRLLILPGQAREIALENLVLRQQLTVFKRRCPRPRLRKTDRLFWVCLAKIWKGWRRALIIVKPETGVSWHRKGFVFWTWISMRKCSGRPEANPEIRAWLTGKGRSFRPRDRRSLLRSRGRRDSWAAQPRSTQYPGWRRLMSRAQARLERLSSKPRPPSLGWARCDLRQ
jgi:hypothetical protein